MVLWSYGPRGSVATLFLLLILFLTLILSLPKAVYNTKHYHRPGSTTTVAISDLDRHDPSRPYHDLYRIDYEQFALLFEHFSMWWHAPQLAPRLFRFLDDDCNNLINFKVRHHYSFPAMKMNFLFHYSS